jgi:hypothetical protein
VKVVDLERGTGILRRVKVYRDSDVKLTISEFEPGSTSAGEV